MVPENSPFDPNAFLKNEKGPLGMKGGGPVGFVQGVFQPEKTELIQKKLENL